MIVATVLRSGGDFAVGHVYALRRMLGAHMSLRYRSPLTEPEPDTWTFMCLTDSDLPAWTGARSLRHDLPGWWAKMELCRPDITGPVLYLDLDTVVVGDVAPLVSDRSHSIVLRDLYRGRRDPQAVQSALMLLTEEDRAAVWGAWSADPKRWMRKRSDQDVYEAVLRDRVRFFQDTHPGMVVGFKSGLGRGKREPGPDARVVVFHGRPRPWASGTEWAEEPFRPCTSVA
jgi:hypothetical protein